MPTAANVRSISSTSRPITASISPAAGCANAPRRTDEKVQLQTGTVSPLQPGDQARRVPAPSAHLLHFRVKLIDQGGDRKMRAVAPRLAEADRHVLAHPVHRKAEIELAFVHRLVAVFHLPRLRRALGDRL